MLRNGAVDSLPDMIAARYSHGIIEISASARYICSEEVSPNQLVQFSQPVPAQDVTDYAAGIHHSALKACEKIDLNYRTWAALSDMKESRNCFNPCFQRIYLLVW